MSASRTLTVKNPGDHVSSGGWRVLPAHADQACLRNERRCGAARRTTVVGRPIACFSAVVAFILAISSCRALLHPRRIRDRGGAPPQSKDRPGADKPSRRNNPWHAIIRHGLGVATTLAAASRSSATDAPIARGRPGARRRFENEVTLIGDNGGACVLDHGGQGRAGDFHRDQQDRHGGQQVELISNNHILGEKENLALGLPAVSFTKTLSGGSYQIYCPGAKKDMASLRSLAKPPDRRRRVRHSGFRRQGL